MKPGHCKILALFLVNPNICIISTANIPCQHQDWWADCILQTPRSFLSTLPQELRDKIINEFEDFPLAMEEAKALHLELMNEQKAYDLEQAQDFRGTVLLCEH